MDNGDAGALQGQRAYDALLASLAGAQTLGFRRRVHAAVSDSGHAGR